MATPSTPGQVHELKDILVQEVSLVDRAANKKTFVIVKREEKTMSGLVPDGKGGFVTPPAVPAAGAPPVAPGADTTTKTPFRMAPEAKQEILAELTKSIEALMLTANAVKDAEEVSGQPTPPEVGTQLKAMSDGLAAIAGKYGGAPAPAAPPPAAPAAAPGAPPAAAEPQKSDDEVQKAGRKIAAGRLSVLQGAIGQLVGLLGELETPPPPAAPPAAATPGAAPEAPLAKSAGDVAAKLVQLEAENVELKKRVLGSNALPSNEIAPPTPAAEPSWPLDMARSRPAGWKD